MAFKMKGNPMARNFGIGKHTVNVKTPAPGIKRDEGNTDLADGRSGYSPFQVDLKQAATGIGKFARKAYDKASQVGMGLKAGAKRALQASRFENIGYSTREGIEAGKKAYKKEKKADEAAAKRRTAAKNKKAMDKATKEGKIKETSPGFKQPPGKNKTIDKSTQDKMKKAMGKKASPAKNYKKGYYKK